MAFNDSAMSTGPLGSQKRPYKSSPVTPLKRRRIQPSPSTGSQRTPASAQILSSYTSTPLTGPRTREQLDRYYEDVKRDASRIHAVKYQLEIIRQDGQDIGAEPESSPEPSESAPMLRKQAVKLLEKILMDNRAIERLEEERKETEVKKRGPTRADTDGVVKRTNNKQQTRRAKIRKEIRNVRKRIGYAWSKLKAAGIVSEPETTAADMAPPRMSSPIISKTVAARRDGDSGTIADESDSEPSLPAAGRTIARSAMSPSAPPVAPGAKDGSHPTGDIGDADTDANADRELVEEQAAPEIKSISKSARVPRRSIFTPDSVDDENHFELNGQEEILTHAATVASPPVPPGSAGLSSAITQNSINTSNEKTQGRSPTPFFHDDITFSSDGEDRSDREDSLDDSNTDSEDDSEDESSDVEVKLDGGEDDVKVTVVKKDDVKSKTEADGTDGEDDQDSDESDSDESDSDESDSDESDSDEEEEDDVETDDKSSDIEVKLEIEDEAVALQLFQESSEDTRDGKDSGDGAAENQKPESSESQHIIQPSHAEPPSSSRPSTGLFERMNGIQTSGSFEAMMADLRKAAAERERQARLAGQVVDSETSDSSDDDSLPYFSPEPEAKPYIG